MAVEVQIVFLEGGVIQARWGGGAPKGAEDVAVGPVCESPAVTK